jgi:hypothetical protein
VPKTLQKSKKPLELPLEKTKSEAEPDVFELMDLEDERQIREELMGRFVDEYVYSFPVETKKGKVEVRGLSYAGTTEMAKEANIRKKALLRVADIPPIIEEHDTYWLAKILCEEAITGLRIWGVKKQSKRKAGGQIDEHAEAIAVSKATRNGLQALMPKGMIQEFIKAYILLKGKVKKIEPIEPQKVEEKKEPVKADVRDIWGKTVVNLAKQLAIKTRVRAPLIVAEAVNDKTKKDNLTECTIDELKIIAQYLEEELTKYGKPKTEVTKPSTLVEEFYNDRANH